MKRFLSLCFCSLLLSPLTAHAQERGQYEVVGVKGEELLKMRAGAGTGFKIILGLPAGTLLQVYSCEQAGHTSWCKVSLKNEPSLKGFVSSAYLARR